ncbi:MAG: hypothetical protein N4J56_003304 [Chroococcidiopsis sp. SAG 2025]|nr:hypothetical protein [Chroococcidiopsis sp. SAG 2025]
MEISKRINSTKASGIREQLNYFRYALILYCLVVIFVIPFKSFFFPHAKLFLPIIAFVLILQLIVYKTKIKLIDTIIVCLILIASSLPVSSLVLFRYTLPICFILIGFNDDKPTLLKKLSYYIILDLFTFNSLSISCI